MKRIISQLRYYVLLDLVALAMLAIAPVYGLVTLHSVIARKRGALESENVYYQIASELGKEFYSGVFHMWLISMEIGFVIDIGNVIGADKSPFENIGGKYIKAAAEGLEGHNGAISLGQYLIPQQIGDINIQQFIYETIGGKDSLQMHQYVSAKVSALGKTGIAALDRARERGMTTEEIANTFAYVEMLQEKFGVSISADEIFAQLIPAETVEETKPEEKKEGSETAEQTTDETTEGAKTETTEEKKENQSGPTRLPVPFNRDGYNSVEAVFSDYPVVADDIVRAINDAWAGTGAFSNADASISENLHRTFNDVIDFAVFLRAQIYQESRFNPKAISSAKAKGLMQIMNTAKTPTWTGIQNNILHVKWGDTDIYDHYKNVAAGIAYLSQQLGKFGSMDLALAAYNAGPGRVAKLNRVPNITETKGYVKNILARYGAELPVYSDPQYIAPEGERILERMQETAHLITLHPEETEESAVDMKIKEDKLIAKLQGQGKTVYRVREFRQLPYISKPYIVGYVDGQLMKLELGDTKAKPYREDGLKLEENELIVGIPKNEVVAEDNFKARVFDRLFENFGTLAGVNLDQMSWVLPPAVASYTYGEPDIDERTGEARMRYLITKYIDNVWNKTDHTLSTGVVREASDGGLIFEIPARYRGVFAPVSGEVVDFGVGVSGKERYVVIAGTTQNDAGEDVRFELTLSHLSNTVQLTKGQQIKESDMLGLAGVRGPNSSQILVKLSIGGETTNIRTPKVSGEVNNTPLNTFKLNVLTAVAEDFNVNPQSLTLQERVARDESALGEMQEYTDNLKTQMQQDNTEYDNGQKALTFNGKDAAFGVVDASAQVASVQPDMTIEEMEKFLTSLTAEQAGKTISIGIGYPTAPANALIPIKVGNVYVYLAVGDSKVGYYMSMLTQLLSAKQLVTASGAPLVLGSIFLVDTGFNIYNDIRLKSAGYPEVGGTYEAKGFNPLIGFTPYYPASGEDDFSLLTFGPAKMITDVTTKASALASNIPLLGALFKDDKGHTYFWQKPQFDAVYKFGTVEKEFMMQATKNPDPNRYIYAVMRGMPGEMDASGHPADEFVYAVRIDLQAEKEEDRIQQFFKARRFPTRVTVHSETGEEVRVFLTKKFFDTIPANKGLWMEPGQAYVIPALKTLETFKQLPELAAGVDAQGNKIYAYQRNPVTGAIMPERFYNIMPGLFVEKMPTTYRQGMNLYFGETGDTKASYNTSQLLGYYREQSGKGTVNSGDANYLPIYPLVIPTRYASVLNYWFFNTQEEGQVADILFFGKVEANGATQYRLQTTEQVKNVGAYQNRLSALQPLTEEIKVFMDVNDEVKERRGIILPRGMKVIMRDGMVGVMIEKPDIYHPKDLPVARVVLPDATLYLTEEQTKEYTVKTLQDGDEIARRMVYTAPNGQRIVLDATSIVK
ncbi:MAG TPA: lytic transglycosylase domain-containing protein, partial [Candidatus Omnitrophota bacterium]|nr:lytic transglycosylase domain-containing protein [Candidatus Omnitrophota bacterium]